MSEILPFVITGLVCLAAGGAGMYYLMKRPTTTKALAMKELAVLARRVEQMHGSSDMRAAATQAETLETLARNDLTAIVARLSGGQS
jgi:hypothetical protein